MLRECVYYHELFKILLSRRLYLIKEKLGLSAYKRRISKGIYSAPSDGIDNLMDRHTSFLKNLFNGAPYET